MGVKKHAKPENVYSKIRPSYYSTITSFYHIRSRERAKYESVLHCSKRIAL